jgi:hypothetical protein
MNKSVLDFVRYLLWFSISLFLIQACVKDDIKTSGSVDITFSVDTLHFDTVFTQIGSATRSFKIFNNESKDIILSSVYLEEGDASAFRLNVDGVDANSVQDVRIGSNDSIYIFVEVTIDPDNPLSESPFVIEEYLIVEVNNSVEKVLIDAWGQNANYIPSRFNKGKIYRLDCDNEVWWDDPKPYVIYGLLYIDTCVLKILAGTQIHVHGGIGRSTDTTGNTFYFNDGNILVGANGSIITIGSSDNPVVFQGDRLEEEYRNTPGQWNGIRFLPGSKGNALTGAVIQNSVFGVYVDSMAELSMTKTRIVNTSSAGLIAFHAKQVNVTNSLIHSNGANSAVLSFGGTHRFVYTTLANFGNDREALFLSNNFCYDFPQCSNWKTNDLDAEFTNCIITGSNKDEVWLSAVEEAAANIMFDHSIIRIEDLLKEELYPDFMSMFSNNSFNRQRTDSLFADISAFDYHLDSLSVAEMKGRPFSGQTTDLDNQQRDFFMPDIGCYEYKD